MGIFKQLLKQVRIPGTNGTLGESMRRQVRIGGAIFHVVIERNYTVRVNNSGWRRYSIVRSSPLATTLAATTTLTAPASRAELGGVGPNVLRDDRGRLGTS